MGWWDCGATRYFTNSAAPVGLAPGRGTRDTRAISVTDQDPLSSEEVQGV